LSSALCSLLFALNELSSALCSQRNELKRIESEGPAVANEKRGIQGIRTMGALLDTRRARTPAGALLELSAMANEKVLLQNELKRQGRRNAEINKRLNEIAAKEQRLLALVQDPASALVCGSVGAKAPATAASAVAATPPDIMSRMRVKEFSY
jgi:hypothetical protein